LFVETDGEGRNDDRGERQRDAMHEADAGNRESECVEALLRDPTGHGVRPMEPADVTT